MSDKNIKAALDKYWDIKAKKAKQTAYFSGS